MSSSRFRSRLVTLLGFSLIAAHGGGSAGADPPGEVQSSFTGEIKPVLYVSDIEASAAFFHDVLGFAFLGFAEDTEGEPYYAEMAAGRSKFGLHLPMTAGDEERVGKQKIYFRVTDLEAHRRRIEAAAGRPGPIKETAWMTMFVVSDADGHEIVFAVTEPDVHSSDPWSVGDDH